MARYDRSPPNVGRTRSEHALHVRSERPKAYLIADVASPLIVAALWLVLPFDASTSGRWIGAIALALIGPVDLLTRRRLSPKWVNFGLLAMRCGVAVALTASVPVVWHPGAIVVAAVVIGSLLVEPLERVAVLGGASIIGLTATALLNNIDNWYLSVVITVVLFVAHFAWYQAWYFERSEVDLRHDEMVDRALMFSWEVEAATGTVLSLVGNVEDVLGWHADELIGESIGKVVDLDVEREILREELDLRTGERHSVVTARHKDGHTVTMREVRLASRRSGVVRGVSIDITELAEATDALRHQAEHDALTGLANRVVVEAVVNEGLRDRSDESVVLVIADLDRFKEINDTLGHPTGDRLLRVLAGRLSAGLADVKVVARLGGDEFAFVAIGDFDDASARKLGERVHDLTTAPVAVDGLELAVACSVGIALSPDHGKTYTDLLKRADIATYQAKRAGGGVGVFKSAPDDLSVRRLQLISETATALDNGEFELHFQPQIDLATGSIVGVEGLTRWRHPQHGILAPGAFLHAIEVAANYHRFTNEMVRQAIKFSADARQAGHDLQVAVNLGSMSFLDQSLPTTISDLLDAHNVAPESLTLEVTESDLLEDQSGEGPVFSALEALGVHLSIDDFGTGYSTFSRLRRLNVDEVKIDREFVDGLGDSEEDSIIVETTIRLAQLLSLHVVAEGVETAEQLRWLQRFGCATAQGFIWSKAVHRDDMMAMLAAGVRFDVGDTVADAERQGAHIIDAVVPDGLLGHTDEPPIACALDALFDRIARSEGEPAVVVRDLAGRLVAASESFRRLVGFEFFEKLIGTRDDDFAHGTSAGEFAADWFAASRTTAANGDDLLHVRMDDRNMTLRAETSRLHDAAGHLIGSVILQRLEPESKASEPH